MSKEGDKHNDGVEQVMVEHFVTHQLPEILDYKEKVDGGAKLEDKELDRMIEIVDRAKNYHRFVDVWPEYKPVIAKILDTFKQISSKALENESRS